jgi:hypothetical protein
MHKEGLAKRGYEGLDILRSTAFLRPVQIVRQFISNLGIGIFPLSAYHQSKGLSSLGTRPGYIEDTLITNRVTNPIGGYA